MFADADGSVEYGSGVEIMERVTLDMTAIRDLTYEDRERHGEGLRLLSLAEHGGIELGIPPQGSLADLRGQFGGDLAERIEALLSRSGVIGLPQLARLSDVTFPSENLFPGYYMEGFSEAWDRVVATWKTHEGRCPGDFDRWYVESHIAGGRDVLLTDDGPLRAMCDRLRDEHGLPLRTESLSEYVARRACRDSRLRARAWQHCYSRKPHSAESPRGLAAATELGDSKAGISRTLA